MMHSELVAQRYATAMLDLATANQALERFGSEIENFATVLWRSKELAQLLANPALPLAERKRVLDALLVRSEYHLLVCNFLRLLVDRGRIRLLPRISESYRAGTDRRAGRVRGVVSSAYPMDSQQFERLSQALSKRLGRELILEQRQDPTLLAGFHVQVEGLVFDGSVRGQLRRLEEQLLVKGS